MISTSSAKAVYTKEGKKRDAANSNQIIANDAESANELRDSSHCYDRRKRRRDFCVRFSAAVSLLYGEQKWLLDSTGIPYQKVMR